MPEPAEPPISFSIGKKIALSFGAILVLLITLGLVTLVNIRNMNRETSYEVNLGQFRPVLTSRLGERALDPETGRFNRKLDERVDLMGDLVTRREREALATETHTQGTVLFFVLLSFLVSAAAGVFLVRGIIAPLKKMMASVRQISRGDLDVRVEVSARDELGQLARYFNEMTTELKKSRRALEELALTDPLTGLYNRRGFTSLMGHQLEVALRNQSKLTVVYADMDNLKALNDAHGHAFGDKALMNVANFLKGALRRSDIVARIGGDEFAIALVDHQEGDPAAVRQRLLDLIRRHNTQERRFPAPIALSIGVIMADPKQGTDVERLLAEVDHLMYEDKRNKKM